MSKSILIAILLFGPMALFGHDDPNFLSTPGIQSLNIKVFLEGAYDDASATMETALNAGAALPGWPKAFFLKSDGLIVDLDGTSQPGMGSSTVTKSLFIIIRHRNHLAILSSVGATLTGDVYSYDFTTSLAQAYGGAAGYKMSGFKAVTDISINA